MQARSSVSRVLPWPQAVAFLVGLTACGGGDGRPFYCGLFPQASAHACVHGAEGPFGHLAAGWESLGSAPSFSQTHQVFHTQLPAVNEALHAGEVVFTPSKTGVHGFFVSPAILLEIRHRAGPWRRFDLSTGTTHCAHFAAAYLLHLTEKVPVVLTVAPTAAASVQLLVERLGPSLDALATDDCPAPSPAPGDGGLPEDGPPEHNTDGDHPLDAAPDGQDGDAAPKEPICRSSGPCSSDEECCVFCHDFDHCH